jgi:alkaline phosphatase
MAMAPSLNRRRWLTSALASVVGASTSSAWGQTPVSPARPSLVRPRNIILLVADGMSVGVPTLAEVFAQSTRGTGTTWWALGRRLDAVCGWCDTASLTSLVTDSAAAASAWGSGSRVRNGAINVLPDGTRLTPLASLARDAGRRIGLVTTTTITHATPAGFAASTVDRNAEEDVARQYLNRVDVLLGGGRRFFVAATRADRRDLSGDFARAGYTVWQDRATMLAAPPPPRALGLFWPDHLPYAIDRHHTPELEAQVPTLGEMTTTALAALADSPRGFFLLVEGGRVDHAAHANDAAAILWDQLAFDDAVARALAFAGAHSDTLVVVTSDHGNANPGLNGMGTGYLASTVHFDGVARARASFGVVRSQLRDAAGRAGRPSQSDTRTIVDALLGVTLTAAQADAVAQATSRTIPSVLNEQLSAFEGVLGQVMANHWGIGWTGTTHTADLAPLLAIGPGSARFHGVQANTDLFASLLWAMDVTFQNPKMTPDEARRIAHLGTEVREVVPA